MDKIPIPNYLDLMIDEKIDSSTKSPVCLDGISHVLQEIYEEIKKCYVGNAFKKILEERALLGLYSWKNGVYPIQIFKLKKFLNLWMEICNKTAEEYNTLYERCYQEATYFRAQNSPFHIKIVKGLDKNLAYFLGVLYADGSLRNIWLVYKGKRNRFQYEITITDESAQNLMTIVKLFENIFNLKTNVKKVYGGKWFRILFSSMVLHRLFNKVFDMPMGYKKGKLRIPDIIKNAPFEIKSQFVKGFFDGDGWCSDSHLDKKVYPVVSVSQSDKLILQDINEILIEKGFNFRFIVRKRDHLTWYELNTKSMKQIRTFYDEVGFGYKNKMKRLENLIDYYGFPIKVANSSDLSVSSADSLS